MAVHRDHPLVGRKFVWTWETGFPGASFEVDFFSSDMKRACGKGELCYSATHNYDIAVVDQDIYMVSWMEKNGITQSVVLNLETDRVYGSFSTPSPGRVFLTGRLEEVE